MTPRMYAAGLRAEYLEVWVLERGPSVDGACGSSIVFTEATGLLSVSVSRAAALRVGSLSPRCGAGCLVRGATLVSRRKSMPRGLGWR